MLAVLYARQARKTSERVAGCSEIAAPGATVLSGGGLEGGLVAQDGVGDGEQLAGDGDGDDLSRLAPVAQPAHEAGAEAAVAQGAERGHVERAAHAPAPGPDGAVAAPFAALARLGREPAEAGDGAPVASAQLGHGGDQCDAGHAPDARNGLEQGHGPGAFGMAFQEPGDGGLDPGDAPGQQPQTGADIGPDGAGDGLAQPVLFLRFHTLELIAPTAQLGQFGALGIQWGRRRKSPLGPQPGQHGGIDPVGLGQVERLREMPGMQRIETADGPVRAPRLAQDMAITAAGRLENRQVTGAEIPQPGPDPGRGIGHADMPRARVENVEPVLRKIDADVVLCHAEILSMSSGSRPVRRVPCSCSGWSDQPTASRSPGRAPTAQGGPRDRRRPHHATIRTDRAAWRWRGGLRPCSAPWLLIGWYRTPLTRPLKRPAKNLNRVDSHTHDFVIHPVWEDGSCQHLYQTRFGRGFSDTLRKG